MLMLYQRVKSVVGYLHRCNESVRTPRVTLGWKQITLPAPFCAHEDPSLVLYSVNTRVLLWQGDLGATWGANQTQALALWGRVLQESTVQQDPAWALALRWPPP